MIESVLVAYDGSEPSIHGFEVAVELSTRLHARLHVLTVADVPEFNDEMEMETVMERSYRLHTEALDDLRQKADDRGIRAEFHITTGRTANEVVGFAAGRGIDLVILGHQGRGTLDRYGPRSVCHSVISMAKCAVMVVR